MPGRAPDPSSMLLPSASGYLDDVKDMALIDALCPNWSDGQPYKRRRSLSTSGITSKEVSEEEEKKALRDNLSLFSSLSTNASEECYPSCAGTDNAPSRQTDNAPSRQRVSQVCIHGKVKGTCKDCGGTRICIHGRQKAQCRDCKKAGVPGAGSQICEHDKRKSVCKICRGSQICVHGNRKGMCTLCNAARGVRHGAVLRREDRPRGVQRREGNGRRRNRAAAVTAAAAAAPDARVLGNPVLK